MTSRTEARAFTLIELLLVLAIIAVVSAVTAPTFVHSLRGNRLRASADQVVRAGRYARSMAVMRQQPMQLAFEFESATLSVTPVLPIVTRETDAAAPQDVPTDERMTEDAVADPDAEEQPFVAGTFEVAISRKLDRVRFESVEIAGEEQGSYSEGKCAVLYRNNGTCTPYVVKIVDDFGTAVTISVDALSGVTTEREEGLE